MGGKIEVLRGDITKLEVDAIVNAANTTLLGGGGVDGAIHRAAGPELLAECRTLGGCKPGHAKITRGYHLPARFVIHTVGPIWHGGKHGEAQTLADCYRNSLQLALKNEIKTIGFPAISCGAYAYPIEEAAEIAFKTTREFLAANDAIQKVIFVLWGEDVYEAFASMLIVKPLNR
jgi:O-acetyl-ADP-ribose deacetylase